MVLLVFAGTLLLAALVSGLAARSVLSTAVLFLVAGFLMGDGVLGVLSLQPGDPIVSTFTELALFAVLFTEGMHVGLRDIAGAWRAARSCSACRSRCSRPPCWPMSLPGCPGWRPSCSAQHSVPRTRSSPRRSSDERTCRGGCGGF